MLWEGYIALYRKILAWRWYKDGNTCRVFIHLLIKANHKENNWKGITIQRGQLITSSEILAEELGLSRQNIRTALKKLKSTNDINMESTNRFTIISIKNYDIYQSKQDGSTNNLTNNLTKSQPKTNQMLTTNNNDNNKDILLKEISKEISKEYPGNKAKAIRDKKLPGIIKKYGKDQILRCISRYKESVIGKDKKYIMNEATFWNGRYIDFLDENYGELEPDTEDMDIELSLEDEIEAEEFLKKLGESFNEK